MRALAGILAIAVASVLVLDLAAPSIVDLEHGSVGIEPQTVDLELLPFDPDVDDPDCADADRTDEAPCPRRYAFHAGATLTVWFSVRNGGPLPIRLLGVSDEWLGQFADVAPLARPTSDLDGGDPHAPGTLAEIVARPFAPVTLAPDDERLIGIEFAMTDDVERACQNWQAGTGIGWDAAPISWSLIGFQHLQELAFTAPISFIAPTEEDCS